MWNCLGHLDLNLDLLTSPLVYHAEFLTFYLILEKNSFHSIYPRTFFLTSSFTEFSKFGESDKTHGGWNWISLTIVSKSMTRKWVTGKTLGYCVRNCWIFFSPTEIIFHCIYLIQRCVFREMIPRKPKSFHNQVAVFVSLSSETLLHCTCLFK